MKHHFIALTVVSIGLVASGCQTRSGRTDYTASGALAGGAIGAGTGAIIGAASHNAGAGALIGGAIGAITGTLVGNAMDQEQRARLRAEYPATLQRVDQGQPLGLADIKALARAGVSEEVILSQIRSSHSSYTLSTAEIIDLKDAGVSEHVIDYMINTPSATHGAAPAEGTVVNEPPPPAPREDYIQAPGPDYVWVGGYWSWYGSRWVWVRGHWTYPPRYHAYWVQGHWIGRGYGWVWVSGHWRY